MNPESPPWVWSLAGASSVALAVVVILLSTRTVQADVRLQKPIQTAASPLVASLAPHQTAPEPAHRVLWKDRIHGIASWYGGVFNGRKTASGETFDMNALTACHPTLPFGSLVRVVNRKNKRSVVVRITDRGDLIDEGRIIDLSYAAAQQIGIAEAGLAKVDLEVLSLGRTRDGK